MSELRGTKKLLLASGNEGKLREFRTLAKGNAVELELLPGFAQVPEFPEAAPTFAENAAGKALYYSRHAEGLVFADDSGLVVPSLGGAPGVLSARYAGPGASNEKKIEKLVKELHGKEGADRGAYFVCVICVARAGRAVAVVSAKVRGEILESPARGREDLGTIQYFSFRRSARVSRNVRGSKESAQSSRKGVPSIDGSAGVSGEEEAMAAKKKRAKSAVVKKAGKPTAKKASGTKKAAGTDPKRVAAILAGLDAAYPDANCELKHENAFQLLISTILSAQCTDVRVNQVTQVLYKKYLKPEDFAYANPAELEQGIRPTGFFPQQDKIDHWSEQGNRGKVWRSVPNTMEVILTLPGVARKTGNVVLGTAFGIASGIVVDTHVQRLSNRLDLTRNEDPKKIEQDLIAIIPQNKWIQFHTS